MSDKEFPVVTWLSLVRAGGEFVVVEMRMQGDEVLSRDVVDHGRQYTTVWKAFKEAAAMYYGEVKQ